MTLKSLKRQVYFLLILAILLGCVLVQKSFALCHYSVTYSAYYAGDCGCYDTYCPNGVTATGNCSAFSACEGQVISEPSLPSNCYRESVSSTCNSDLYNYCGWKVVGSTRCAGQSLHVNAYCCGSQAEADSAKCVIDGGTWQNGACKAALDSTACDSYREQCEEVGGTFHGNLAYNETGCSSYCDMCSSEAQSKYRQAIAIVCCKQGKVPPSSVTSCHDRAPISTMSWSIFDCDSRGGYDCECEKIDSSNVDTYQSICIDGEWEEESSSSAGGSSGSGEGSSSSAESSASESPYPEGCEECPWLDSILDTLKFVKWNTDEFLLCLQVPSLCPALLGDTVGKFSVDSILLKYIQPLLDSTVKLDSSQIKILSKLDTNLIKMLRNDSTLQKLDSASLAKMDSSLMNDSLTRSAINGGFSDVDSALHGIARDLGISTDSVIAHLDSILKGIPDSVLDSIVKYQAFANESIDSAIYGTGKGFSLVDSLIDSTIKYFSRTIEYDSAWRETWADSTSRMIDYMRWQPGAINSALGYGDTASTTLRGDLDGIRGALDGIGGDLDGIGDALGGIDSALGGDGEALEGEGYDDYSSDSSAYMSVLDSAYGAGEFSDSTVDDAYNVGVDDSDTCFSVDCLASRVGVDMSSASSLLYASIDSSYDAMEDSAETWFTQIKDNLKFVDFDSVFVEPLKNVVPNTNECPSDCFGGQLEVAGVKMNVNYGICKVWNVGGFQFSVLLFIRLLLRIVCAVSCIYIGLWYIAGRKT